MPAVAASVTEVLALLHPAGALVQGRLVVTDEATFRSQTIRDLAWTSAFAAEEATVDAARWIVWEASQELGAHSASIQDLYLARSRGEVHGFTVPAINLRAQTFDMARTIFETAQASGVGALILELARSEQTYTFQRPAEYATSVLAGAIAADWRHPVFIQGDHYQFNAVKYKADPEKMTEEIRAACRQALAVGYRNIDIDSSTLVDLSQPNVDLEQRQNYQRAAELTALIRELEPAGITISVGGEIGEVGKQNSTEPELRAYLEGFKAELERRRSGAVQHGASTLPDELFHHFPAVETAEIHLATGFQNALFDNPAFPAELSQAIDGWCWAKAADERKPDQTDEQFVYTSRKKAIGPFKRELWDLPVKDQILADQAAKIAFLFKELAVLQTREMVDRYIKPVIHHRDAPAAVREVLARA